MLALAGGRAADAQAGFDALLKLPSPPAAVAAALICRADSALHLGLIEAALGRELLQARTSH